MHCAPAIAEPQVDSAPCMLPGLPAASAACLARGAWRMWCPTPPLLQEAIIVGGILAGYSAGYAFIDEVGGWRSMYGLAAPLALLLGVGMVRGRAMRVSRSSSTHWQGAASGGRIGCTVPLARCRNGRQLVAWGTPVVLVGCSSSM
eukprot:GHRQ01026317.1.p2 GENE.GHRQ01026317.1~~GHRQ01026317.1.p2  ORF type:complete len:146 (-),score=34.38 GHRQ01026317.1:11-448(-)